MTTLTEKYFYGDSLIERASILRICNDKWIYEGSNTGDCTMKNIIKLIIEIKSYFKAKFFDFVSEYDLRKFNDKEEEYLKSKWYWKLFYSPFNELIKFVKLEEVIENL